MGYTAKKIVDEIVERADNFDSRQANFMSQVGEWGDLFKVKPPKRSSDRTFSNPRQTEFFRAASAVGTLSYRMMTAEDPPFAVYPTDLHANDDDLDTLTQTWITQMEYAKWRQALLRGCHFAPVFGTVINQFDYRIIGVSPFGRQIPVTVMMPRVLDQVYFDAGVTDFDSAAWVGTADISTASNLLRLADEAKRLGIPWNPKALEAAAKDKEEGNKINWRVAERLKRAGYVSDADLKDKKELLMFYGKLDCLNDGIEYVAAVINRKHLVRFHANKFQHGRRPFSVMRWVDFDSMLGYGMGQLLSHQHRQMDANRQKVQDLGSFSSYNMWWTRKGAFEQQDFVARPLNVLESDQPDDIKSIQPNMQGAEFLLNLDQMMKQEFRAASNASDTLQAIVTDATATASSLAQNEAIRAISVRAEHMAEGGVREYLEVNHANNVQNIRAPFNINAAGDAKRVYPAQLQLDVDIKAKTCTDKDFQPKRLEKLIQLIQILTSTKSAHPDQMQISILPLVKEVSRMLQVNPSDVIMKPGAMPSPALMGPGGMGGLGMSMIPDAGGGVGGPVPTPVGPVLAS